jgi:pimeloyl-ACP methyl ester carboxylesterase
LDWSRLHVESHGPETSPVILLVHGAPDRSATFRGVLEFYQHRRVIAYDRRGYGRSLEATPARTMRDHANDLVGILESCPTPPIVIAHSFGSNVTMLAATLRPAVFAAMGLWEPPLPWIDWWPKAFTTAVATSNEPADEVEAMYRSLLGDEAWERMPPEVQSRRRAEGLAFQVDMASELQAPFDPEDVLVPALVGYGTATSDEHRRGARQLVEWLPSARLHATTGAGHFAPRTHPKEFAAFMGAVETMARGFRARSRLKARLLSRQDSG